MQYLNLGVRCRIRVFFSLFDWKHAHNEYHSHNEAPSLILYGPWRDSSRAKCAWIRVEGEAFHWSSCSRMSRRVRWCARKSLWIGLPREKKRRRPLDLTWAYVRWLVRSYVHERSCSVSLRIDWTPSRRRWIRFVDDQSKFGFARVKPLIETGFRVGAKGLINDQFTYWHTHIRHYLNVSPCEQCAKPTSLFDTSNLARDVQWQCQNSHPSVNERESRILFSITKRPGVRFGLRTRK